MNHAKQNWPPNHFSFENYENSYPTTFTYQPGPIYRKQHVNPSLVTALLLPFGSKFYLILLNMSSFKNQLTLTEKKTSPNWLKTLF